MAGQEQFLLEGGMSQPSLVAGSGSLGRDIAASSVQPHHAILGVVLIAVIGLWALDRFGFRFAVTAGRR